MPTPDRGRPWRPWTPWSAALAPVALIGGWTVAAARQPASYDSARDTISALAARHAQDRWIMTVGLALLGACHLATAAGLVRAAPSARLLLALGGAATVAVAAQPQPSAGHVPAASVGFIALAVWPALSRVPTRRAGIIAAVWLSALVCWLFAALQRDEVVGLAERAAAGAQAIWPLATIVLLWTGHDRTGATRSARAGVSRPSR